MVKLQDHSGLCNLPDRLRPQWESWLHDLGNLADAKVHRCYIPSNFKAQHYELHHFSDASASGYGMCTYLRAVSTTGEVHCSLVMGRSRVPPTKVTTIPQLELSAAIVAVRTGDMLKKELAMEISEEIGLTRRWYSDTSAMEPEDFMCLLQTEWNASNKAQIQPNGGM